MIKYSLIVFLFFYHVQGELINKSFLVPDTKIVGGKTAPDGGIKYQASLKRLSNAHFCGGALLNKRWILTAAHCAVEFTPSTMTVVVGTNQLVGGGETYEVDKLISHENYDDKLIINDIALIRVTKDIEFNDKVQPIDLPTKDVKPGDDVLLSGWGRAKGPKDPLPNNLQMLNQTVISVKLCQFVYNQINKVVKSEMCSITATGKGSCQGDSGGPLVAGNQIVGVVSWGVDCRLALPDVNTRVYSYVDWIKKHIASDMN